MLNACIGAICYELVHWYKLRTKLSHKKYDHLIKSRGYWVITILTIIISGVGAFYLLSDEQTSMRTQFLIGATFPSIFINLTSSINRKRTKLGKSTMSIGGNEKGKAATDISESSLKNYFI